MTIREQILEINSFFINNRENYHNIVSKIDIEKSNYVSRAEQIRKNYQNKRDEVNAEREEVLKFYRIAKDNTKAELAIKGKHPTTPNIRLLSELIYKIDVHNYNDPTATKIVELISSYVAYYDSLLTDIDNQEKSTLKQLESQKRRVVDEFEQKKQSLLKICSEYLHGYNVSNLRRLLDTLSEHFNFESKQLDNSKKDLDKTILYGYQKIPVSIPAIFEERTKSILGNHYSNGGIDCPCGINLSAHAHINVEYIPSTKTEICNGIRALIINILNNVPIKDIKISIFDSINYSANLLGDMSQLAGLPGGTIESLPQNEGNLKTKIKELSEYYQIIEKKIGGINLFDYNKKVSAEERIPLRLLIINKEARDYRSTSSEMLYLLNNSHKLGIIIIELACNYHGGSKGTDSEKNIYTNTTTPIKIISDRMGNFYKLQNKELYLFKWHQAPEYLPNHYITSLQTQIQRKKIGADYFSYFALKIPEKSVDKRKPIIVPFARDENDVIVNSSFENENFAAYMMGASRSGKSTLLHTMICSIITNFHPDEVELWLVDFKKTEFRQYALSCPPHLKYLLLEESEDLIFDLIDELTDVLNDRMRIFANNGWSKLSDVPTDTLMPVIFVIIDEFAQVSQKIHDSKLSGETNYVRALENILAKGGAFGMKFIFASQSFNTGVEGLSQTARKQIQLRFALKNTTDEIKDTLNLNSYQKSDRLMQLISSIRVYETLFKRIDENTGATIIDKFFNLKVEMNELSAAIHFLNENLHPTVSESGNSTYVDKHPLLLTDDKPATFKSMIPQYRAFEKTLSQNRHYQTVDSDDILVYLGIPCSFKQVKPIPLKKLSAQNMLIVGGDRDLQANLLLSIINSWKKKDQKLEGLEIWAHEQYPTFKKYRDRWKKATCASEINKIMERSDTFINSFSENRSKDKLIICFGLDLIYEDFDDILSFPTTDNIETKKSDNQDGKKIDLWKLINNPCVDTAQISAYNNTVTDSIKPSGNTVNFRKNMEFLISKGPKRGIHFVFFFLRHPEYRTTKIKNSDCQHKVIFPMSAVESRDISGLDTSTVNDGTFIYSDGYRSYSMRPHIYKGIPCNGWILEDNKIVKL